MARASVLAHTTKLASRRAETAALTRRTISSVPHHLLAVEVAAALGVDLVLEVAAGQPAVLERLDRTGDVHRLAEAGVGVDQRRKCCGCGDLLAAPGDLGQRRQPDVGQRQVGRQRRARDVAAVEAELLDQHGGQRADRAGEPQQPPARQTLAQALPRLSAADVSSPGLTTAPPLPARRRDGRARAAGTARSSASSAESPCAAARKRSWSSSLTAPSASVRNLCTYCVTAERPGAQGMCVGDGERVLDHPAVVEGDDDPAAERLLRRVGRVVAPRPLRVLVRGHLVPQGNRARPGRAVAGVRRLVVPAAVLERDGEDVHDRVVERLAAGLRVAASAGRCAPVPMTKCVWWLVWISIVRMRLDRRRQNASGPRGR